MAENPPVDPAADTAAPGTPGTPGTPAVSPALIERRWLAAIALAALIAIPAALVTLVYVGTVNSLTHAVWVELPATLGLPRPVVLIGIPVIGGFLVGLAIRFMPGGVGPEPAAGHGLGGDEHGAVRMLPGVIVASILSLVAGASLGPEAPLVTIIGGLATLVVIRLKLPPQMGQLLSISGVSSLASGIFGNPLASGLLLAETAPLAGLELYRRIIPALAAGTVGYFVFAAIVGQPIDPMFPGEGELGLTAFVAAIGIGILGGGAGILYIEGFHRVHAALAGLDSRPILKVTLGGLVVGLVAVAFGELTLFSGEHQIGDVVEGSASMSVGALGLLLVGKVIASLVSLSTGFRGGRIFPIMFIGGVLGLIVSALIPAISAPVAVASGMGAMGVSALRIPLFMVILAAVFTSLDLIPVILVAVVTSYAITVGRREL